jgi:uncharacterized damage-inducible protein DinB
MLRLAALALFLAATLGAQAPDLKTLSGGARALQNNVKNFIIGSADKMPADGFAFKATPDVRSFGAIIAHVADSQYAFCSAALGEKNPAPGIEKSKTTKDEISAAVKEAFAYCDKAYAALTDANASEPVKFFGSERTRMNVLQFNTAHNFEHYGNLVTYLRLKGIVPPSSDRKR